MRMAALFVLMVLMLAGCSGSQKQSESVELREMDATTQGESESVPPLPAGITANLSFYRNTSDVMDSETVFPVIERYDFSNVTGEGGELIVYYFYSSGCGACNALKPEIERLVEAYPGIVWLEYDIVTANGSRAYKDFAGQYNLSTQQRLVPQVLVNGTIITDRFKINKSLEGIIRDFQ